MRVEFGDEATTKLQNEGLTGKNGLHPDIVADLVQGCENGADLVAQLSQARPLKEELQSRVDECMISEHGEIATPEAMEMAADAAIHNEARARTVATEMKALSKSLGSPRELAAAARWFAESAIARVKVRSLQPMLCVRRPSRQLPMAVNAEGVKAWRFRPPYAARHTGIDAKPSLFPSASHAWCRRPESNRHGFYPAGF